MQKNPVLTIAFVICLLLFKRGKIWKLVFVRRRREYKDKTYKGAKNKNKQTKKNRQMQRIFMNARVYSTSKINLTWPKIQAFLFISNTLISNTEFKLANNQVNNE